MKLKSFTPEACLHIHHDKLLEWSTEPLSVRRKYIRENKPKDERSTRLRWMTVVKGPLPPRIAKARAAYDKAWAAYDKAGAAYTKAEAAYETAGAAYTKAKAAYEKAIERDMPALLRLHAKEHPGCPWDEEQQTLFPKAAR